MKTTQFSYNWNNKLNCSAFTTLRLWNPDKYAAGEVHHILLKKKNRWCTNFGHAEIIKVRKIAGSDLNEYICHLDTGYSIDETKKVLSRMYPKNDIDKTAFAFVLYKFKERRM